MYLVGTLTAVQEPTMRRHVVELLPVLVATAMSDAAAAGAPPVPQPSVNLASFAVLASAAAEYDFDLDDIRSALGIRFRESTAGDAVQCSSRADPNQYGCQVRGGVYLELNGLVASPLHAEAILTVKWTQWTLRRPMVALREIRVKYMHEDGRWAQKSLEVLSQT